MTEPLVDLLARQLARGGSRRGIIRSFAGLLLAGPALIRSPIRSTAQEIECDSGWETYCTQITGAETCIDFATDSENCGVCGRVCPRGTRCADGHCTGSEDGQPPAGLLSASVQCAEGPHTTLGDELLDVVVSNRTDQPVTVAHIGSLTGPAQPGFPTFVVAAGEQWQGLLPRTVPDGIAQPGAIVTMDAGVIVLPCGDTDIPFIEPFYPEDEEGAAVIMVRTLSVLETWSSPSFDGLFALLHPDARELVSYSQLACWYWNFIQTERPAGEATVASVRIGPWTWLANGKRYDGAAEVTYRQPFAVPNENGEFRETEEREATIHLVQTDGIWRWFFGTDPNWLTALPDTC